MSFSHVLTCDQYAIGVLPSTVPVNNVIRRSSERVDRSEAAVIEHIVCECDLAGRRSGTIVVTWPKIGVRDCNNKIEAVPSDSKDRVRKVMTRN